MSITKWVPVEDAEMRGDYGMGTWKWCKPVEVGMNEELKRTEQVRAEVVRQHMNQVVMPELIKLRRKLAYDEVWGGMDRALMWDVAKAMGYSDAEAAYIADDIEKLWRAVQDEV